MCCVLCVPGHYNGQEGFTVSLFKGETKKRPENQEGIVMVTVLLVAVLAKSTAVRVQCSLTPVSLIWGSILPSVFVTLGGSAHVRIKMCLIP